MKLLKMIIGIIIIGLFLTFAIQNNEPMNIKFFNITVSQIPTFIIIITMFIFGFITGQISGWLSSIFTIRKEKKQNKET